MAAPTRKSDLRNCKVTTEDGVDVKSTKMISGEAKRTAAENAKNSTDEYTIRGVPGKDRLGGKNHY
jgi:hypothetical protein